jgi:DUF1365 family protein
MLAVSIDTEDEGGAVVAASLSGQRLDLTDANLWRLTLRYPLVTLRTITLIHWQAFKLWLKGVPYFRKQHNPHLQTGVLNKSATTAASVSGGKTF